MIFTDNSRQADEGDCPRKRYHKYHSVTGFGIDRMALNLPTATGIHIHEPVQKVMEFLLMGKKKTLNLADKTTRAHVRLAIKQSLASYAAEIEAAGSFRDNSADPEDTKFFLVEQSNLVEGFTWAWLKVMLPTVLSEFEIIAVEKEESLVLGCGTSPGTCGKGEKYGWEDHAEDCQAVVHQARPDMILRRKSDGVLTNHDLKTHKYVGDAEIQKYKISAQLNMGSLAAERRLKEPVPYSYIHAFEKGARKKAYTPETRDFSGRRQQQSHFCHVGWLPASPPTRREDKFDVETKWYQRTPVWEMKGLVGKPPEMSNVEWLVEKLPLPDLQKRMYLIGPYERQPHMLKDRVIDIEHNEKRWQARLWDLFEDVEAGMDYETALAKNVPATWNCLKYGSDYPCAFFDLCSKNGVDPANPLASGLYTLRTPHHVGELLQLRSSGVEQPKDTVAVVRED